MNDSIIDVRDLSVFYGKKCALDSFSFAFKKNSITCIIGKSGCGKSTLLRSINRSIEMSEDLTITGKIDFAGKNIKDYPIEELRKRIGIVTQNPVVFPFSIRKNLEFPLKYHYKLTRLQMEEKIEAVLDEVQLLSEIKDSLNKNAENLSGGQKQRLCLARTLLTKPDVLLLDEPCSALDPLNQACIEDLLLNFKEKISIIMVTHNIGEAKKLQDCTIFIQDGKIAESGSDIFANAKTKEAINFLR